MASHPTTGTTGCLHKLLAFHTSAVQAIQMTLDLLKGAQTAEKRNGHSALLASAIALDAARHVASAPVTKRGGGRRPNAKPGVFAAQLRKQRTATATLLKRFDPETPLSAKAAHVTHPQSLGVLIHHGYLRAKGDGYVRTDKRFEV
jgi:hypothetical protein